MNKSGKYLVWTVLSVMGAFALGYIALNRGEQINALWIVVASVCIYLIAYRFYGLYIAKNVLAVDPTRMTPAVRHNDGLDDGLPSRDDLAARRGGSRWCGAGFHGAVCFYAP